MTISRAIYAAKKTGRDYTKLLQQYNEKYTKPRNPKNNKREAVVARVATKARPRDQWPEWAVLVASQAGENDTGVGDTINRKLGMTGQAFKMWAKLAGIPCGCSERQEKYNTLYPY